MLVSFLMSHCPVSCHPCYMMTENFYNFTVKVSHFLLIFDIHLISYSKKYFLKNFVNRVYWSNSTVWDVKIKKTITTLFSCFISAIWIDQSPVNNRDFVMYKILSSIKLLDEGSFRENFNTLRKQDKET